MSDPDTQLPSPSSTPTALPVDPGAVVTLLFVVSGATALFYEIAFIRAFVELYGSTAGALGAIVGSFLVCLALGSLLAARYADGLRRPLRFYSQLEGVAALGGVAAAWLLGRLEGIAATIARQTLDGDDPWLLRFGIALLIMLVPIGALGATLPVLARFREREKRRGLAAGGLQLANTLGAVAGVMAASLWLVPVLGLQKTVLVAAAANLAIAVLVWLLFRRIEVPADQETGTVGASVPSDSGPPVFAAPFLLAALASGFVVVALEVLLFRGLAQITRGSIDSLGILLATFLLAQSVGTGIGVVLSRRSAGARGGFVLGSLFTAAAAFWALWVLFLLSSPEPWPILMQGPLASSFAGRVLGEAFLTLVLAGPVALFGGIAFPCVCQLKPRSGMGFGRWVALQVSLWTLGAALAGLWTASWLIPALRLQGAVVVVGLLPVAALLVAAVFEHRRLLPGRTFWGLPFPVALGLLFWYSPAGGLRPSEDPLQFFRSGVSDGAELRAYGEGPIANVAVVQEDHGGLLLKVNNQYSLGGSGTDHVESMQAFLPALLAGEPEDALVMGVGTGITVGALRAYGVPRIDCVELVPMVNRSLFNFEPFNGGVLAAVSEGSVKLYEEDARTFVRGIESERYDLVVGDLFFPWQSEAGFLYTREHFTRIKELLRPGGVFCQWLPAHQLRWEEIGIVGRTFAEVFKGSTVWLAKVDFPFPVLALVAGRDHLQIDAHEIERRITEHPDPELLARHALTDYREFLSLYVGDEFLFKSKNAFQTQDVNTIDRPLVEFLAGRRMESDGVLALHNRRRIYEVKEDVVGRIHTANLKARERADLQRELSHASKITAAMFHAETLMLTAHANRALPPTQQQNDPEALELEAFRLFTRVLLEEPEHEQALERTLKVLKDQLRYGNYMAVAQASTQLIAEESLVARARVQNLRGMSLLMAACVDGQTEDPVTAIARAAADFRAAVQADPGLVEARLHLGLALFLTDQDDGALDALADAREQIIAPSRAEGRGLPLAMEAIYQHLMGDTDTARRLVQAVPPQTPYLPRVLEKMGETRASDS